MLGLKKRRRIQLIAVSTFLLVLMVTIVGYALRDGISYFRSPSQVLEEKPNPSETFRIGGLVEGGSIRRGGNNVVAFEVTDGNASIKVVYDGILPDLFSEGQGAIALGKYDGKTFIATDVLAKHDETYLPKEVADALKEQGVFRILENE